MENLRVLIVEDSANDAKLIIMQLRMAGYSLTYEVVETTGQINAALDKHSWDIVISDYVLPELDGLAVLKLLQKKSLDMPCIIVSGEITDETAVAAMKAGARDYIMKDNLRRLGPSIERELRESEIRRDRNVIKNKLEESEERYRNLIETTSDFIWEVDINGVYLYISPKIFDILGYWPQEIIGKTPFDFMPSDESRRVVQLFMQYVSQKSSFSSLENINYHKDGHLVVLETSGVPFFNIEGRLQGFRGIDRDITERKKAEEALSRTKDELETKVKERTKELKQSEEKYRSLVDNAREGIIVVQDELIEFINNEGLFLTGYSAKEITGKPFLELVYPEDRELVAETYQKRITGQAASPNYEFRLVSKDGSILWIQMRGARIIWGKRPAALAMFTNITESRKAEEQIQITLNRLYSILSSMPLGILLLNQQGVAEFANQAFCDIFHLKESPVELKNLKPDEIIEKIRNVYLDPQKAVAHIKEILSAGKPVKDEEVHMQDGRTILRDFIPIRLSINDNGRLWIHGDITVLQKAEENLLRTQHELEATIQELQKSNEQLKAYNLKLIQSQEHEKERTSDLLNDTIEYLSVFKMEMESLLTKEKYMDTQANTKLRELLDSATRTLDRVTEKNDILEPGELEQIGLVEALKQTIEQFSVLNNIRADFKFNRSGRLNKDCELAFFRITQEALDNIQKHAKATRIEVKLSISSEEVNLTIWDDGQGFDTAILANSHITGGINLRMTEWSRHINAAFNVKSLPGNGTTVSVKAPCEIRIGDH